ncbi:MAG: hypothetical protein WD534_03400 [Phycisphaeraceae bacterium]
MSASPGTIDLQVNGYAGVDFNQPDPDALTAEQLHHACQAMAGDAVAGALATVISDDLTLMQRRLRRLATLREADPLARQLIVGLHVEGPFLNEQDGYRGAHPLEAMQPASEDAMQRLLDAGDGLVRLVTLAPERDPGMKVIRRLAKQGVRVSAGHCDPSLDVLDAAIDAGLSLFTHLGNGCPMSMHRHDNVIQRALARADRLWLCFIADGVHVPFPALGNYLRLAGDRAVVVTDAMAAAGLGPGLHRLGQWEIEVGDDLAAWAPDRSHLVGSAMTMPQATKNLAARLRLPPDRVRQLTRDNPGRALGMQPETRRATTAR